MPRKTVSQEGRVILEAEPDGDAPPNSYREVQILVPVGNELFMAIDQPIQRGVDHPGTGPNRTYKLTPMPIGQSIVIKLQPHQYLTAMAGSAKVHLGLIIEYIDEG
jgi:hypothetical protein